MFGATIWAGAVLVIIASAIEAYDQKLAMLIVMVTLFALFIGHAGQIVAILKSITPAPASAYSHGG